MNPRDRYAKTLLFEEVDNILLEPGHPRESTLAARHRQGLPEGETYYGALLRIPGIEPERTKPAVSLGVDLGMIPRFQEKVLEHKPGNPGSYVVQDWMGAITEIAGTYGYAYILSAKDFVIRKWRRFAVQTRRDWEDMKKRYDPRARGRFPDDFAERCAGDMVTQAGSWHGCAEPIQQVG